MISESKTIQPNDSFYLGIKFELEKGWHTYWENPGDAGEGASIEWSLPKGVSSSNTLWPGPERIPVDPLMTFGYNDEVVLLTKITTQEDIDFPLEIKTMLPGSRVKIFVYLKKATFPFSSIKVSSANQLSTKK